MKFLLILLIAVFLYVPMSFAHDFNTETMSYILSNPDASWSDFQEYVQNSSDSELQEELEETQSKLATILSLPGKKYVANYALENPNFSFTQIQDLVRDDPMLSEIGSEVIYSFLSSTLQEDTNYFSLDYFLRFIYIGFTHITSGYDHILFLMTLIICLPKRKNIFLIITTFTLAHSLTIILGGLGLITLPSTIVEPIIVSSIGLMAIYAANHRVGEQKQILPELVLIFILGLFHGLGFAGFFRDILSTSENTFFPILAFNIGVELGQILIISGALIALHLLYKKGDAYKNTLKNIFAGLILCMSLFWISQYIFI